MKSKSVLGLVIALFAATAFSNFAIAYDSAIATYAWDASTPNYNPAALVHPGTIDLNYLVMGDFLGLSASQPNAPGYGDSGESVNWDDGWTYLVGDANTNGDQLDGLWVQIIDPATGWWDLGFSASRVAVSLSQDHGPYLAEGLEVKVYGSNDLWGSVSSQAILTEVYLDGWRPHSSIEDANGNGWCSDDIVGVFELPGAYRYVKIAAWSSIENLNEPEVDAVASVTIPIFVDIKPGSWPNPINTRSRGVLPVAICGTAEFDAMTIDPATVKIYIEGVEEGIAPLRWSIEDAATPWIGDPCCGHAFRGDGYLDLVFQFDTEAVVGGLGLSGHAGDTIPLVIMGKLRDASGGIPVEGNDCVWILPRVRER